MWNLIFINKICKINVYSELYCFVVGVFKNLENVRKFVFSGREGSEVNGYVDW